MPHMGLNQPIRSQYLQSITNLAKNERPVFLIVGTDDSHVVIKNEVQVHAVDPGNLKSALKVMKTVSPTAAGKLLLPEEVDVIRDYVQISEEVAEMTFHTVSPDVAYLKQYLNNNGIWFKMEKAEGLVNIEDAKKKADQGDKTDIRRIAAALSATDGLESLGRIIAADLWNGNNDRFTPGGTGNDFPRVTQNPGNVLLAIQGATPTLKPIGLDAYEAMGMFRSLGTNITDVENVNDKWGGRLLGSSNASQVSLKAFCKLIVEDIEDLLGPRNRKFKLARTKRLPRNAAERIQNGVNSGALPIKAKMRQQAAKPNPPAGLINRLTVLGWWP